MNAVVTAIVAALLGAGIGYYLRGREFRRDHRLRTYADFVAAFLEVSHAGSSLLSLGFTFGDKLRDEFADRARDAWVRWAEASRRYEVSQTELRLIGSDVARRESEALEDWIAKNIRAVPPFTISTEWRCSRRESSSMLYALTWSVVADVDERGVAVGWSRHPRNRRPAMRRSVIPRHLGAQ